MGSGFEILSHTADTGFRARAETLPELLSVSAMALASIALDCSDARPAGNYEVAVTGNDVQDLLVNLLNEVLWLIDGRRIAPAAVHIIALAGNRVQAAVLGEPRDDSRHPPRIVVKAATYHQLKVQQDGGLWTAEVFLDI